MISLFGLEETLVSVIAGSTGSYKLKSGPPAKDGTYNYIPPSVYSGYIPAHVTGDTDVNVIPDYPSIIVQATKGRHTYIEGFVTAEIVVGCYNDDLKMRGYRDVLNLIMNITTALWQQNPIGNNYSLQEPYEWMMLDSTKHPYYRGHITSTWLINTPSPQRDPITALPYSQFETKVAAALFGNQS
jgi:hypothetical protein